MSKGFIFRTANVETLDRQVDMSASRVLAIFNNGSGTASDQVASERASVVLKSVQGYQQALTVMASGLYDSLAGTDLSAILYPAQLIGNVASTATMPTFDPMVPSGETLNDTRINFHSIVPFFWDHTQSDYLIDRSLTTAYDCMPGSVTSGKFYGSVNRFVDPNNIRTLGMRLPMLGVGWGYTTDGEPWPQEDDDNTVFTGGSIYGHNMDPRHYVVAPIEMRYDKSRHVWSSPKDILAEVTEVSGAMCAWIERTHDTDGTIVDKPYATSGTLDYRPAIETNLRENTVAVGDYIWLKAKDTPGAWLFQGPASGGPVADDIYVKVSASDTTTDYLYYKASGDRTWIDTEVVIDGGVEVLQFNHIGPPSGYDPEKTIYVLDRVDSYNPNEITTSVLEVRYDSRGHFVNTYPSGTLDVPIEIELALDDLTNVGISGALLSDGDLLQYDDSIWKWKNVPASAIGDKKVAVEGGTADYLDNVLIAGSGITLDVDGNTLVVAAEAEDPGTSIDTLGPVDESDEPIEGTETAATDTWTANGTNGLALWQTVRVVYNESGDEILYEFRRKLTFDRWGRLYSVSAEKPIEVEAPEAH